MSCLVHRWLLVISTLTLGVCSPASIAAGYQVLGETSFPINRPLALVHGVKATSDGGYLILGQAGKELRLIKTYPSGEKEWERIVSARRGSEQYPLFALEAEGGGYWVVGMAKELEFMSDAEADAAFRDRPFEIKTVSFIARFAANGEMQWRLPLGTRENFLGSRFVCGVKVSDGIVLVGSKYAFYDGQPPRGGRRLVVHPWIIKLNIKGDVLWESMIADDGGGLISTTHVDAKSCGGPYRDEDGSVTFGLAAHWRPTYFKDGVRIVTGAGTEDRSSQTYLIVRVDSRGREVARRRLDSEVRAQLLRMDSNLMVVSNPAPAYTGGIRRILLNQDLSIVRSQVSTPEGYSLLIEGAAARKDGGVLLAGERYPASDRRPTRQDLIGLISIAYLTTDGQLINLPPVDSGFPGWSIAAFAGGRDDGEAALVLRRDAKIRLLRVKYRD